MTNENEPPHADLPKSGNRFADRPLKDKIGDNLKRLYDDVVKEDVPDDFLALLAKADQKSE